MRKIEYRNYSNVSLCTEILEIVSLFTDSNEDDWLSNGDEVLDGFKFSNSDDPVTKGLSVWSEPILCVDAEGSKVALLVMDAEGLFNDQGDDDITVISLDDNS